MALKLLHTADWQIGKAFANITEDAAYALREQRISTIKKIASLAKQHEVAAVLVAGDVFEFENMAEKTLIQTIIAMSGFKGQWLLMPGNHDPGTAESVWAQLRNLDSKPDNVIILDTPTAHELPGHNAVVLSAPLQRKHDSRDITDWFDTHATAADTIRIGLAHGSVDNRLPDRGDAPNTISDKRATKANLDYLALGDWHGTQRIDERTWYSGTHETDRFRDNDSGNVLLVTIEKHGVPPIVEKISTGRFRWHQLAPAVVGDHGTEEIIKALEALGEPEDELVIQLTPKGSASLNTRHLIEKAVGDWDARVRYLDYRADNLITEASDDDLESLGSEGFIGEAVTKLRTLSAECNGDQGELAELALQILYSEHKQLAGKKS